MRKTPVAIAISSAMAMQGFTLYHYGPVFPYVSTFNRRIFGELIFAQSVGKTSIVKDLLYAERYQAKVPNPNR